MSKGDKDRTSNRKAWEQNYQAIDFSKKGEFAAINQQVCKLCDDCNCGEDPDHDSHDENQYP
jgi:hypothetical protein